MTWPPTHETIAQDVVEGSRVQLCPYRRCNSCLLDGHQGALHVWLPYTPQLTACGDQASTLDRRKGQYKHQGPRRPRQPRRCTQRAMPVVKPNLATAASYTEGRAYALASTRCRGSINNPGVTTSSLSADKTPALSEVLCRLTGCSLAVADAAAAVYLEVQTGVPPHLPIRHGFLWQHLALRNFKTPLQACCSVPSLG